MSLRLNLARFGLFTVVVISLLACIVCGVLGGNALAHRRREGDEDYDRKYNYRIIHFVLIAITAVWDLFGLFAAFRMTFNLVLSYSVGMSVMCLISFFGSFKAPILAWVVISVISTCVAYGCCFVIMIEKNYVHKKTVKFNSVLLSYQPTDLKSSFDTNTSVKSRL